jgi:hypothetical protein
MLVELFPLLALGNVTMSMGMVCWAIVGAQGRYRLSTTIATSCAFFITIPIAAVSTFMRVDLQGLTFAVVVGYTVTAMLLSLCVLMSDWKALAEKISEEMSDLSLCSSGLIKLRPETPPITPFAMITSYTPPINPPSRPGIFASHLEIPDCQLLPTLRPVSTKDVLEEVLNSVPLPPVLAVAPPLMLPSPEEARVMLLPLYQNNCPKLLDKGILLPLRVNPEMIAAAPSAAADKSSALVLSMSTMYSTESTESALPHKLEEDELSNKSELSVVSNAILFDVPALLVNKTTLHQPAAKSLFKEVELYLPEAILEPPVLITACPSDELRAVASDIPSMSSPEPTDGAVLPSVPEANDPQKITTASGLVLAGKLLETPTIHVLLENSASLSEIAAKPAAFDIITESPVAILPSPPLIVGVSSEEPLPDALILPSMSPSEPNEKAVPALLVASTATCPDPVAKQTPIDIANNVEEDVNPTSSDKSNGCIGDVLASLSSSTSVYENTVLTDESLDVPNISPLFLNTAMLPDIAAKSGPYGIAMEPLIAGDSSEEPLPDALILPSMSPPEPNQNAVQPLTPEADATNLSASEDPTVTDKPPITPIIPALLVASTATCPDPVAKQTPIDIANNVEDDVNPTSSVKSNDCIGDVLASSSTSVYAPQLSSVRDDDFMGDVITLSSLVKEDPVMTEESPVTPNIPVSVIDTDTNTLPEFAVEPRIDNIAMDHHGEYDPTADANPTSSDSNDGIIEEVTRSSSSSSSSLYEDALSTIDVIEMKPRDEHYPGRDVNPQSCDDKLKSSDSKDGIMKEVIKSSSSFYYDALMDLD